MVSNADSIKFIWFIIQKYIIGSEDIVNTNAILKNNSAVCHTGKYWAITGIEFSCNFAWLTIIKIILYIWMQPSWKLLHDFTRQSWHVFGRSAKTDTGVLSKKKCMRHMNRTKQHKNHSNLYILLLFLFNKDLLLVPYLILVASHRNYTLNIKSLPILSLCELRLLTETCFRAHM